MIAIHSVLCTEETTNCQEQIVEETLCYWAKGSCMYTCSDDPDMCAYAWLVFRGNALLCSQCYGIKESSVEVIHCSSEEHCE